ncbi:TatD family hydrolase [Chrysosporum bergii ANA360D]|uniref:TatD family hydrolase n=1 Tax=Chrysosporum bergii ANA360D TaxID=617107 RepID=A0AA43GUD4_9CYAN|nr:TatD family hydrolase [Chrysosporum bergii]MDH6061868.1 TatD family hydrolase [Chrysosporum bergii ANA360D]
MMFIDPHIHMTSRTTDDYEKMSQAGIVAVIEPAFWLGQPRTNIGSFQDYFSSLLGWERFRASQFGIKHYCTIGLNSKEANNEALAAAVMEILPLYACKQGVVAIGEIGYDDITPAEDKYFRLQLELAKQLNKPVMIHTPHRDKKAGTIRSMDVCVEHGLDPNLVIIDHNNEETVAEVLERGFWAAFTIYPHTKMGNARMVEIIREYAGNTPTGRDNIQRIIIDSSADWGISDPLAVPKTAWLMLERGIPQEDVTAVCYQNALSAYSQSGEITGSHWLETVPIDQRQKFHDNSILRGQEPIVDFCPENTLIS